MNLLSSGATLRLIVAEPTLFLFADPAAVGEPSHDGVLSGEVELVLRKPAQPVLSVHFIVEATLKLPDGAPLRQTPRDRV